MIWRRLGGLLGKNVHDREIEAEFRHHVELQTELNVRAGMTEEEARRRALIDSGGIESSKEFVRDQRSLPWIETLLQDLRFTIRTLRKAPGFVAIALLTLALGIGANTAMFGVVRKVLKPLAVESPERTVLVWTENAKRDWHQFPVSVPDFLDWKATGAFSKAGVFRESGMNLRYGDRTDRISTLELTGESMDILGQAPLRGRLLTAADSKPGSAPAVLIREDLWRSRFAAREDIAGLSVVIDGKPCTVVGVVAKTFAKLAQESAYTPIQLAAPLITERGTRSFAMIGQLAPGVSVAMAQKRISEVAAREAELYPEDRGNSIAVQSIEEAYVHDAETILTVLSAAVALVLLIACANLASLLLARGSTRGKEMALRSALGASKWRLVRQLLTESSILSVAGGMLGLLPAFWGIQFIQSFHLEELPDLSDVRIDPAAFLFALALSLLTGVLFGLAPALHAWKTDVNDVLKSSVAGSMRTGGWLSRLRGVFVASEIAFAVILMVVAGLLLRSLFDLQNSNPGYDPHSVLSMRVALSEAGYATPEKQAAFYDSALEKLRSLPGVTAAAGVDELPSSDDIHGAPLFFPGRPEPRPEEIPVVIRTSVTSGYFEAMGQPVVKGRSFSTTDRKESQPVAIIDEFTARKFWPGLDPIGQQIRVGSTHQSTHLVVGVVADAEQNAIVRMLKGRIGTVYLAAAQRPRPAMSLIARTTGDPRMLEPSVRQMIREIDPDQPIFRIEPVEEQRSKARGPQQLAAILLDGFALLALVLASIGIYGVIAWQVSQRGREFGIRMSLGATPGGILRMAVRQGLALTAIGLVAGLCLSLVLTRFLGTLLHGVAATDSVTFAGVTFLFLTIAGLASWIPARRAATVDPSSALRIG